MSLHNTNDWESAALQLAAKLEAEGQDLYEFQQAVNSPGFTAMVRKAIAQACSNAARPTLPQAKREKLATLVGYSARYSIKPWSRVRRFVENGEAYVVLSLEQMVLLSETSFAGEHKPLGECAINGTPEERAELSAAGESLAREAIRLYTAHQEAIATALGDTRTLDDFKEELGVSISNLLAREGVEYFASLTDWTENELLDLRNFGEGSLNRTKVVMRATGYQLKEG